MAFYEKYRTSSEQNKQKMKNLLPEDLIKEAEEYAVTKN